MRVQKPRQPTNGGAIVATLAVVLLAPTHSAAQAVEAPYSVEEILFLLDSPMTQTRIGQLATEGCLDFDMNAFTIAELREGGAQLALIEVLNAACVAGEAGTEAPTTAVVSVAIDPPRAVMEVGAVLDVEALPVAANGLPIESLPVTWSTSDARSASVSTSGRVRALRAGSVTITAEAAGVTASVEIRVVPQRQSVGGVFAPGLILPGASQFKTGRPARGAVTLLAVAGAVAWGFTSTETTQFCASPVSGGAACPPADVIREDVSRPNLVTGIAGGFAIMLISAIDAALHTRGQNAASDFQIRPSDDGGPAFDVGPDGAFSASWRIHVR